MDDPLAKPVVSTDEGEPKIGFGETEVDGVRTAGRDGSVAVGQERVGLGGVAGASCPRRQGEVRGPTQEQIGRGSETLRVASVAAIVQVSHGEHRGIGITTNQAIQKEITMGSARGNDNGAAGVGSAPLRRANALLRYAEPTPAKGTFLFGERRGHFYRWTTPSRTPSHDCLRSDKLCYFLTMSPGK